MMTRRSRSELLPFVGGILSREPELQIGEVNVTSHADLRKWLWLWDLLEDGYDLRTTIVIVDRNGTVSQSWTFADVQRLAFG